MAEKESNTESKSHEEVAPSVPYTDYLFERLRSPEEAGSYLAVCLEEGDEAVIALCLQNIAEAWGVAATLDNRVAEEREACAKICEGLVTFAPEHMDYAPEDDSPCGWCDGLEKAAATIHSRGVSDTDEAQADSSNEAKNSDS